MAGPVQPFIFPVMWARDASSNFLRHPEEMRAMIERAGFQLHAWNDQTASQPRSGVPDPPHSIARIIMGDDLAAIRASGKRNNEERRMVTIHAVFDRDGATPT